MSSLRRELRRLTLAQKNRFPRCVGKALLGSLVGIFSERKVREERVWAEFMGKKMGASPPSITATKIFFKINLGTGIGEVVGTDPDRVSEEGVREHDGGG